MFSPSTNTLEFDVMKAAEKVPYLRGQRFVPVAWHPIQRRVWLVYKLTAPNGGVVEGVVSRRQIEELFTSIDGVLAVEITSRLDLPFAFERDGDELSFTDTDGWLMMSYRPTVLRSDEEIAAAKTALDEQADVEFEEVLDTRRAEQGGCEAWVREGSGPWRFTDGRLVPDFAGDPAGVTREIPRYVDVEWAEIELDAPLDVFPEGDMLTEEGGRVSVSGLFVSIEGRIDGETFARFTGELEEKVAADVTLRVRDCGSGTWREVAFF